MDLLGPNSFGGKEKKKNPPRGQASEWTYRTRVQNFRVYFSRMAWTFGLLCGKMCNLRSVRALVSFSIGSTLGDEVIPGPTKSDLRSICANFFCRRALDYLQSGRSEKKKKEEKMAVFLRKPLTMAIDLFLGLWSVVTIFRHQRQS